jgi:nicotinamidase-related amidase
MAEVDQHSLSNRPLQTFYRDRGLAGRVGFGVAPAILVIDLAKAWTNPRSPLGTDLDSVIAETRRILAVARRKAVPVFFTTMAYEPGLVDCGENFRRKTPGIAMLVKGSDWVEIDPRLEVQPGEVVIAKQRGSAFFGTSLLSQLIAKRIDTVIITGCSTSGCVRATGLYARDYNLRPIVPREAVGDRSPSAHEANLFDIDARIGDVVSVDEVLRYLEGIVA